MDHSPQLTLSGIAVKTTVVHTLTYFVAGALAYSLFDYKTLWDEPAFNVYMRDLDDPVLKAGPLFQPIRGILLGVLFYMLRREFFEGEYGWFKMWATMVVLGMFCTFGPASGSIEGLIYSTVPWNIQFGGGSIEVLAQALSLSAILFYWVRSPEKWWLTWGLAALFGIVIVFSILGLVRGI